MITDAERFPEHIEALCRAIYDEHDLSAYPAMHDALVELGEPEMASWFSDAHNEHFGRQFTITMLGVDDLCTDGCSYCACIRSYRKKRLLAWCHVNQMKSIS